MDISSFIDMWRQSAASERANKDSFLRDLCDVLGVPHPDPATGDPERDRYVFERDAVLIGAGEKHTIGKIDLYKHGCFILEAKQGSEAESKKMGSARRGTPSWNVAMIDAYGQAVQYASTIDPPPPFLIVTDIGECFDLYACFDGSRRYLKFPDGGEGCEGTAGHRAGAGGRRGGRGGAYGAGRLAEGAPSADRGPV